MTKASAASADGNCRSGGLTSSVFTFPLRGQREKHFSYAFISARPGQARARAMRRWLVEEMQAVAPPTCSALVSAMKTSIDAGLYRVPEILDSRAIPGCARV